MGKVTIDGLVDVRLRELGVLIDRDLDELTAGLHEHLSEQIVPLQGDDLLLDLLFRSVRSNLATMALILRGTLPVEEATPPREAAAHAQRLAQRGISPTSLVRAYRLGQQLVVEWGLGELARIETDRDAAYEAGRRFTATTFTYIDSISEGIVEEYESERERWLSHRNTVRAEMVEQVVAGAEPEVAAAEKALGYRLRQQHVAVVLWQDPDADRTSGHPHFAAVLDRLALEMSGGTPLAHPADGTTWWGWVPSATPVAGFDGLGGLANWLAEIGVRVALGDPSPGLEGFRTSHHQARRVRRVALAAGGAAPFVIDHGDAEVRTAALLSGDLTATQQMVRRSLGRLALDTEAAARLRETLLAFLSEKSSYLATSERIHLHKNTVRYRIERAVAERGRPLDDERLELELALVACRWLGPSVLTSES